MIIVILSVISTLFAVSMAFNVYFVIHRERFEARWLSRETRALDRAHAAELRAGQQIDAMLERVSTAPRLELDAGQTAVQIDPDARKYYADDDDPVEDRAWNEYRGEPDEDEAGS